MIIADKSSETNTYKGGIRSYKGKLLLRTQEEEATKKDILFYGN